MIWQEVRSEKKDALDQENGFAIRFAREGATPPALLKRGVQRAILVPTQCPLPDLSTRFEMMSVGQKPLYFLHHMT